LSIQNEDYVEESADIESSLNDLTKTYVVLAIAKLQGVPETITALNAAQKDFENVALKQAEGESVKKDLASASTLKKKSIIEINNNLVGYMNTMPKVKPATYEATAKTIDRVDR
jgi:cbb3-type cytochrome oxidase cytochrome c subunit